MLLPGSGHVIRCSGDDVRICWRQDVGSLIGRTVVPSRGDAAERAREVAIVDVVGLELPSGAISGPRHLSSR